MPARWIKISALLVLAAICGVVVLMASRWPLTRDSSLKALLRLRRPNHDSSRIMAQSETIPRLRNRMLRAKINRD